MRSASSSSMEDGTDIPMLRMKTTGLEARDASSRGPSRSRSSSSDEELQSLLSSPGSDQSEDAATAALLGDDATKGEGRRPLGTPGVEQRFFFQRSKAKYDPDAIATQPSVFDDPDTLEEYRPPDEWENVHRFDPDARWTWREEHKLIRKIDSRIMMFAALMFMALELDRSNIYQALTDDFLDDLDMTTNDYNLGNSVFKFAFLCAEVPSQLVAKWVGPDIWIPTQMVVWSLVGSSQYYLQGRTSFLLSRACLGILQGGFIPEIVLYLSYFYKHHELSLRLGFFWTASAFADVLGGFLAFGILHLRGVNNRAGWRWLFLIEGLITLVVGVLAFGLMPSSPTSTGGWLRGSKGWFTSREETIMVNRVIREDPSKSSMHNREPLTPKLLWQSIKDFDLWPLYILGLNFQTPMSTPSNYLTLSLKELGFGTFGTNLLVVPSKVLHVLTMLGLTYIGEVRNELTYTALFGQLWAAPFILFINIVDINSINKWLAWLVITLLLCYPNAHPIQVGWNSRNSNTVRSRTVSAALYNMSVQTSGIIAANIYRQDDAPRYERGNKVLLAILVLNIFLYLGTKLYYTKRNEYKERKWNSMTQEERMAYLATTTDKGNKRLEFRFAH